MLLRILLFVQLLYVVNQIHFPIETGLPGVAAANVLFLLIILAMRSKPDTLKIEPILQRPMFIFFGALLFGFVWAQLRASADLLEDLTYLKNAIFFPLFYFLYLRCGQDEKTTRLLIIFVMVVAAVAGLEAINEGLAYGIGKYNPLRRASGPFGVDWHHANRAGVFYGMFAPMFIALALFLRGQKLWRIAAIGGIVLIVGGALFTYSRQAYFLLLLGAGLLFLRKSLAGAIVLSVILVALSGFLPDSVTQRVEETKQTEGSHGHGNAGEVDVSTSSRWEIWDGALSMWREHPLGVGLNRFKSEIGNYSSHKKMDAHNFYVLTFAEMSLFGLIPLLMFFASLFKLARFLRQSASTEDPEFHALALGFTVTTVCMLLGGVYGSPHFEGSVMGPYWALCGLLERYAHLKLAGAGPAGAGPREPSLVERFPLAGLVPGNGQSA